MQNGKRLFSLIEPERRESAVVVEVPHAGLDVPATYLANLTAPARSIAQDADLYVDELYADAPLEGATLLVAHTSRYVLDLNRGEDDWDREAVSAPASARSAVPLGPSRMPRGLIWRLTTDGAPALARPLTLAELDERVDRIHRPYHRALWSVLERKREKFGYAVLLAAHSMPSNARTLNGEAGAPRADIVPGTQGRTTSAPVFIECVDAHARAFGYTVRHDDPYRGGFSARHYGQPHRGLHAVQVELARRLYMDERTCARNGGFDAMRSWCRSLVAKLVQTALR
ncbi:N-formylglutamate amidohydrolase [Pendulispora rubella]|uniref:N-formylglutamate amidohydrolase n=1 Tax=Pendulispora rubella TaxID=2741070 RepID=A0ABZ2KTA1_9BACT